MVPAEPVPGLGLQRLLDDQPRGEIDQLAAASGDESLPLISSESSWRVRMEPGILLCMGCVLPLGPTGSRPFLKVLSQQEHTLPKIPSSS